MSSSIFDISEYYRKRVHRGNFVSPQWTDWFNGDLETLTITPSNSPENYILWIEELWFYNNALNITSPDNRMVITYPDYNGINEITITISNFDDLKKLASKSVTIDSKEYDVIVFDPPIKLRRSNTKFTFSVAKHSNVSAYVGGNMDIIAKNMWTIEETDY